MHIASLNSRRSFPPMRRTKTYATRARVGRYRYLGSTQQIETAGLSDIAPVGASLAVSTGAIAAGSALGTVVPVVGTIVGALIGSLLSAHFAREAGAKNENAALTQVFPAVYQDIVNTINQYNSGAVSGPDAITVINQINSNYWQTMAQYQTQPGTHNGGCTAPPPPVPGPNINPTACNSNCTAGCCIGCDVINSWTQQAITALTAGSGTIQFGSGGASKYGFPAWSYPSLKVSPPAAGSAGSVVSDVTSANIFGIPIWVIVAAVVGIWLLVR